MSAVGDGGGAIDINALIPSGADGPAALAAEQARVGIGLALAVHRDALQGDPDAGNGRAIDAAMQAGTGIGAVAVLAPIRSGDPAAVVASLASRGAMAFRVGTAVWYGSPATPSAATDSLLAAAARTGRPLLIPIRAWGDATAIGERTADLGVPVILVGAHYTHITDDLAAAERWPHLHLETSSLAHFGAIETAVGRIGAERILFGSGMPERPPSAPRNAVLAAAISDDAKRAILGGNAARLLGISSPPVGLSTAVSAGGAFDVHGHLPPTPWDVPDLTPVELADAQTARGVGRTVVSSIEAIAAHAPTGNAATVAACAADPRLVGYLVADPGDLDTTRRDLRRWGGAPGIVGVKVHCEWSGHPTASPEVSALFVLLAEHGRPVKIHVAGDGWDVALERLAHRHPTLSIIAAHAGPGAPSRQMARVAAATVNVHLELSSSFAQLAEVRAMVAICATDRFLFGSDAPLLEPSFVIGTYLDAGFSPATHPAVFRENAQRVFGIDGSAA